MGASNIGKTFGPVPSRRLGRSLGINNIPPKVCTYSCVYCQVGRTVNMQTERQEFYDPQGILNEVEEKIQKARDAGEHIDYLTFVPDGEPTLDINLGREIEMLRPLGIKVAVITNASLIWREDVRDELSKADWVSLKLDCADETTWRRVNRPNRSLQLSSIFDGMVEFAEGFDGELATETMLVKGINDGDEQIRQVASILSRIRPGRAYLAIPTRPPAEKYALPPDEETLTRAYQILSGHVGGVEYLIGYEGNAFAFTGNVEEDLLSITAVHPMREEAVRHFLAKANTDWSVVRKLIEQEKLVVVNYEENKFYVRKLNLACRHRH